MCTKPARTSVNVAEVGRYANVGVYGAAAGAVEIAAAPGAVAQAPRWRPLYVQRQDSEQVTLNYCLTCSFIRLLIVNLMCLPMNGV